MNNNANICLILQIRFYSIFKSFFILSTLWIHLLHKGHWTFSSSNPPSQPKVTFAFPVRLRLYLMSRLCVVCCCCVPRRARGCEPARRGVCQRQTPPGRGEAAHRGAGPPGCPALRHLQTATGQSRLCQQNPRQVKGGIRHQQSPMCVKHQSSTARICAPSSISALAVGYTGWAFFLFRPFFLFFLLVHSSSARFSIHHLQPCMRKA